MQPICPPAFLVITLKSGIYKGAGWARKKEMTGIHAAGFINIPMKKEVFMPDFGNAFSGLKADRALSPQELVRAIRFMVAAEYEAVQLYTQLAESTDNELARRVLLDIADEEIVHAGEFLTLLKKLAPEEEGFYRQGAQEVLEMEAEMSAGAAAGETEPAPAPESPATPEPAGSPKPSATVGSLLDKD